MKNILIVFVLLLIVGCSQKKKAVSTVPIAFKKEGILVVLSRENKSIAQFEIEIADNDYERETGLMHRESMLDTHGMLFIFEQEQPLSFYMKNTQLSLDILFIDSAKKIVDIHKNTTPYSLKNVISSAPAQYVLELNAGSCDRLNIQNGMAISYQQL